MAGEIDGVIHSVQVVSLIALMRALEGMPEFLRCEAYVLGMEGQVHEIYGIECIEDSGGEPAVVLVPDWAKASGRLSLEMMAKVIEHNRAIRDLQRGENEGDRHDQDQP